MISFDSWIISKILIDVILKFFFLVWKIVDSLFEIKDNVL